MPKATLQTSFSSWSRRCSRNGNQQREGQIETKYTSDAESFLCVAIGALGLLRGFLHLLGSSTLPSVSLTRTRHVIGVCLSDRQPPSGDEEFFFVVLRHRSGSWMSPATTPQSPSGTVSGKSFLASEALGGSTRTKTTRSKEARHGSKICLDTDNGNSTNSHTHTHRQHL